MPFYEYRHPDNPRKTVLSEQRGDRLMVDGIDYKRVWSFQITKVMHHHLNPSTGTVVSSRQQFRDELKRLSEEHTERTGIPHNYEEIDLSDKDAVGVTGEYVE